MTPAELPAPYAGPPLRIAYVGNFRHSWCTEVHVAASLESLGHTVLRCQEDVVIWQTVVRRVKDHGVHMLMWTRTWPAEMSEVEPVLKELAAEGIPTVSYHLDRWFGLDRQHQVDDQPFFRTSLVVSPDDSPQWAEHGVNHFWLPPGVYGPECEPVPPNPRRWPWDVVFVGCHPYPHPEWQKYRTDLLSAFRAAFGRRFAILPRERRGTPIRGRDLQELYATVPVVLGDSCLAGESFAYWSDRCPESLGRGATLIHPIVPGMDAWYRHLGPDQDFIGYNLGDFKQAVVGARYALDNPEWSRTVGEHGRRTVLARDTYAHRMGTVLAVAEGIYGGYREVEWERASPEVERDAGVSFSARLKGTRPFSGYLAPDSPPLVTVPPHVLAEAGRKVIDAMESHVKGTLAEYAATTVTPLRVKLNRWSAVFEPRPGTTDAEVIGEVWTRNDYRVSPEGFSGTVVDVGANCGAFSVMAAKAGASKVLAFEPEPSNLNRLVHHMDLNGVAHRVVAYGEAVTGTGLPVVTVDTGGGARVEPASGPWDDTVQSLTLAARLDGFGPVEFLKMDIEGGEYEAFAACPVEALARVDRIALEFHGPAMPHLSHLNDDGKHLERWGELVAKLADAGRVETFGHPMRGGLIWWKRY